MTAFVRAAANNDFPEILRLAYLMWGEEGIEDARDWITVEPGPWDESAPRVFAENLEQGNLQAFVVDDPDNEGRLLACGIAWIHLVLPAPWVPTGKLGYLQWFYTEREHRNLGYASAIIDEFKAWFVEQEATLASLHSSDAAESLYRKNGFVDSVMPNLWIDVAPNLPTDGESV